MKHFCKKLPVFLFAFLIGIGIYFVWNILQNKPQIEIPNDLNIEKISSQVTVCQIEDYSDTFDEKMVNFQATAYVIYDGTITLYPKDCYVKTDNMVFVKLELKNYSDKFNNLKTLLTSDGNYSEEVDVKVIGKTKIVYDNQGYKYCVVYPTDIELISALRKFEPKGAS